MLVSDVLLADAHDGQFIICEIHGKGVVLRVDTGPSVTLLDDGSFSSSGRSSFSSHAIGFDGLSKDEIPRLLQAKLKVAFGDRSEKLEIAFPRMKHTEA